MTKLKSSNCDKTQIATKLKSQIATKLNNSNSNNTQKLKFHQNSKNSNRFKTQNIKQQHNSKTTVVTKPKN